MLAIRNVLPSDPHLHLLIGRLDEDLYRRYPPEEVFVLDFNDPDISKVRFSVVYDGEIPIACGAIRPIETDAVELKRFYVEPAYRRQGIAAHLLNHLEGEALRLGFESVKLETGTEQPESLAFYKKHGYLEIPRFGEYAACPTSICFSKRLRTSPGAPVR